MPGVSEQTCPHGCDLAEFGTHEESCPLEPRDPPGYDATVRRRALDLFSGDLIHGPCGRKLSEHPGSIAALCRFPAVDRPAVEFTRDTEPRVRVVGLPDTVHLPGDVLEALDHLARVCRTAYGMGVEVTADGDLDEVRAALDTIRRRLDL